VINITRTATPVIYGINGLPISTTSGYGTIGASHRKRSVKGFDDASGSAVFDIDFHNATLRQRARILYMSAPIATSAIRTNRTNVVGCGLQLKSRLNRSILEIEAEDATEMEKIIEAEFNLWAGDKRACDATGVNDFYAIQQLAFTSWLLSGDAFVLFKQVEPTPLRPYSLRLHVIEADRISTPPSDGRRPSGVVAVDGVAVNYLYGLGTEGKAANGNKIHDGVEVNKEAAVVAYYICTDYPTMRMVFGEKPSWQRVQAYGEETDLPNILQIMDTERPDQYRGVPYLAQVIEPMLQLRRYTDSEIMAALVESFFTAYVKTAADPGTMPYNETGEAISREPDDYEMGPGTVNIMKPGEDIAFADPKRPTSGFSVFLRAIAVQIGASLEVPADLLMKEFNASYSASRAALLEAWKAFKMRREWFVSDFCRPVYTAWLSEAVARGRIDAPGFFDDPLIRSAWLGSEWIGPSQGQLDPVKEIEAELKAIGEGITTREQATVKLNGGSWDANIEQIAREIEQMKAAGIEPVKEVKTSNEQDDQIEKILEYQNGQSGRWWQSR
jgi:lambda family phage portal protein